MTSTPVSEGSWQLSAASVRGKGHVDSGLPNQDFVHVATNAAGDVVCAVVSDGAGTAARSGEGSKFAADFIAERMCQAGKKLKRRTGTVDQVREELEICIELVRSGLESNGSPLREFHCTLVMWLSTPCGAYVAQIGDSVALSTHFAWVQRAGVREADFFPEGGHTLHEVERGEYANETHFITEPDWRQHLRVSELPADLDAVVLMTDGAMDIAMLRGKVFRGFLSNLVGRLVDTASAQERHDTIHAWLDDPQTYKVTGDDKTLFVAVRQQRRSFGGHPVHLGEPTPVKPSARTPEPPSPPGRPQAALPAALMPPPDVPSAVEARGESTCTGSLGATTPTWPKTPFGSTWPRGALHLIIGVQSAVLLGLLALSIVLWQRADKAARVEAASTQVPIIAAGPVPKAAPPSEVRVPKLELPPAPASSPQREVAPDGPPPTIEVAEAAVPSASAPEIRATTSQLRMNAGPRQRANGIQVTPAHPVKVEGATGQAQLRWEEGPELTLRRIHFDRKRLVWVDSTEGCRRTTVLGPDQHSCIVKVRKAAGSPPGIAKVTFEFDDAQGVTVQQAVSFEIADPEPVTPKS